MIRLTVTAESDTAPPQVAADRLIAELARVHKMLEDNFSSATYKVTDTEMDEHEDEEEHEIEIRYVIETES